MPSHQFSVPFISHQGGANNEKCLKKNSSVMHRLVSEPGENRVREEAEVKALHCIFFIFFFSTDYLPPSDSFSSFGDSMKLPRLTKMSLE